MTVKTLIPAVAKKEKEMVERNAFDIALRDFTLAYAPKQVARCGDIVTAAWGGWKHPHKVKITMVSVEIASIDLTIGRRKELGLDGWLIVQHQYIGRRVKADGELAGHPSTGFFLTKFTTVDGQRYESIPSGFNHVGLVFALPAPEAQEG